MWRMALTHPCVLQVEEKVEKIGQLEHEVAEKDVKVEAAMQELELQQSELAAKDHLIQSLHQDLHRVSILPSLSHALHQSGPWHTFPNAASFTHIHTYFSLSHSRYFHFLLYFPLSLSRHPYLLPCFLLNHTRHIFTILFFLSHTRLVFASLFSTQPH